MAGMAVCPCGSGLLEVECCERYRDGRERAPTAEALMRSRYTAYVHQDEGYLRRTWHPTTRPRTVGFDRGLTWVRLEVVDRTGGSLFDTEGTVRFVAHYTVDGRPGVLREDSRFVREGGEWLYVGPHETEPASKPAG